MTVPTASYGRGSVDRALGELLVEAMTPVALDLALAVPRELESKSGWSAVAPSASEPAPPPAPIARYVELAEGLEPPTV